MARIEQAEPDSALRGKVAVVTGAAQGIGRAVSEALGKRGASVLMGDVNSDLGELAARHLASKGLATRFMRFDTRQEWDVERFVFYAAQIFGRLDILVTCAGVIGVGPVASISPEEFRRIFETNVLGTALAVKHAAPLMERVGGGAVVTMSSVSGQVGFAGLSLYCASKAAIVGLTRALAVELAPKSIRVNAVLPSLVDTPMLEEELAAREKLGEGSPAMLTDKFLADQPIARLASTDDIAEAVCFLASPRASMITGAALPVDGGLTIT